MRQDEGRKTVTINKNQQYIILHLKRVNLTWYFRFRPRYFKCVPLWTREFGRRGYVVNKMMMKRRPRAVQTPCRRLLRSPDRRVAVEAHAMGVTPGMASAGALARSRSARLAHVHPRRRGPSRAWWPTYPTVPVGEFSPSTRVSGRLLFTRPDSPHYHHLHSVRSELPPPTSVVGGARTPPATHWRESRACAYVTPLRLPLFFFHWLILSLRYFTTNFIIM